MLNDLDTLFVTVINYKLYTCLYFIHYSMSMEEFLTLKYLFDILHTSEIQNQNILSRPLIMRSHT